MKISIFGVLKKKKKKKTATTTTTQNYRYTGIFNFSDTILENYVILLVFFLNEINPNFSLLWVFVGIALAAFAKVLVEFLVDLLVRAPVALFIHHTCNLYLNHTPALDLSRKKLRTDS